MPTQLSGSRTTSTIRLLSILVLTCFLGATAAEAQSWTAPVTPELWNERLEIGPVAGLTTIWHQAPVRTAIPLGATIRLRTRIPMGWSVRWTGAREIERIPGWSTAEVEFRSLGASTVAVAYDDGSGEQFEERTVFDVLNTTTPATVGFEPISVAALHLSADSVVIDPRDPNASSSDYFFRSSSVAALRQVGEGHYSTSTNRTLLLEAIVQPSGFAPLIEWRLDGVPQRQLGSPVHLEVYTAQPHVLSAGPPEDEKQVQLDTYMVQITSHQRADDIAEGVPVTFRAITDPPGYEGDITWIASTGYGSAQPWIGTGPELTVTFEDTVSAEESWLGVRADNVSRLLDRGKSTGEPILSPLACKLSTRDDFFDPEEISSLDSFCKGPLPSSPPTPTRDECVLDWLACTSQPCVPGGGDVLEGFLGGLRQNCSINLDDNLSCTLAYDYCLHRFEPPVLAAGTWCCSSCTFGALTSCNGCKAVTKLTKCDDSVSGTTGRPTLLDCPGISGQTGEAVTCVK